MTLVYSKDQSDEFWDELERLSDQEGYIRSHWWCRKCESNIIFPSGFNNNEPIWVSDRDFYHPHTCNPTFWQHGIKYLEHE